MATSGGTNQDNDYIVVPITQVPALTKDSYLSAEEQKTNFIRNRAKSEHVVGGRRKTFMALTNDHLKLAAGYYTLSLQKTEFQSSQGKSDSVCMHLGHLSCDVNHGEPVVLSYMLKSAFVNSLEIGKTVPFKGITVNAGDLTHKEILKVFGFTAVPGDAKKMFIRRETVEKALAQHMEMKRAREEQQNQVTEVKPQVLRKGKTSRRRDMEDAWAR
jgi:hypothetical protein